MWNLKFTCMTKLFHMYEKISHVIKCMEKKFTHMTKIFHMYYKISHAYQKVHMHVKCWCGELVFFPTLISHGSFFSHPFHTIFTHIALVVLGIGVCNSVTFEVELFEPKRLVRGTLNEIARVSLVGKGLLLTAVSTTSTVYIYKKNSERYREHQLLPPIVWLTRTITFNPLY